LADPTSASGAPEFHVLVLAAGASTRLGSPKQLARVRGRPALQIVVEAAAAVAGQAVTVVVGAHAAEIMPMLSRKGVSTVVSRRWEEGLGASIRAGIAALPPACEAVMVVLGDQVAVTPDDLRRLASAWKGQEGVIAAAVYQGRPGVPAIFPRWCFQELAQLKGDQGAKHLIQRHASRLVQVPMDNAAVDLDTPEDLARLNAVQGPDTDPPHSGRDWSEATWLLPAGLTLVDDEAEEHTHAAHHRPK
jgi:molybdenum cofactor cytidylyltransferase